MTVMMTMITMSSGLTKFPATDAPAEIAFGVSIVLLLLLLLLPSIVIGGTAGVG
jgi:hypothetical protein